MIKNADTLFVFPKIYWAAQDFRSPATSLREGCPGVSEILDSKGDAQVRKKAGFINGIMIIR